MQAFGLHVSNLRKYSEKALQIIYSNDRHALGCPE